MLHSEFDRLAAMSSALEAEVPSVSGLFSELIRDFAEGAEAKVRRATYVLGTIKSGKSTLLSAIVGADVLPRGSGVKTFNLTRINQAKTKAATVRFKTSEQLLALLRFDFRMLGFPLSDALAPYEPAGIEALAVHLARFEDAAKDDGRLERLEADVAGSELLRLSLARVRHVVRGLMRIHAQCDGTTLLRIRNEHYLALEDFSGELASWANSVELAALIQEIDLGLPFPADVPASEVLVDCQGSDSLNPLDFAAVDAALHRADRILYVVSSRLLLRQADRALLRHVQAAGLAQKTTIVLNVEAFEPLPEAELEDLEARMRDALSALGAHACPIVPACALLELRRRTGHDEASMIRGLWQSRDASSALARIESGFAALVASLARASALEERAAYERAREALTRRIRTAAQELLARDRIVYGVEALDVELSEVRASLSRIMAGERTELSQRLARLAHDLFDTHGPIQQLVDGFLKAGIEPILAGQPLPESLRTAERHGPVMAEAMESFNRHWTLLDQQIRMTHVRPFLEQAFQLIRDSVARLARVVPSIISTRFEGVDEAALPSSSILDARLREELARYSERNDPPESLSPIALLPALAHGLATEFYARKYFEVLRLKLAKQAPQKVDARKLTTLWERTLRLALKAAAQDQGFSVSSARENLKFQYLARATDLAYGVFDQAVMSGVEIYYRRLGRLAESGSILLSKDERAKLEQYVAGI